MKKIAIDLDDVLSDFSAAFNDYIKKNHGIEYSRDEITTYPLPDRIKDIRFDNFYTSQEYNEPLPIKFAQEAVEILGNNYELIIISIRPDSVIDIVTAWLDTHFKDAFQHVHLIGLLTKSSGEKMTKGELAKELGVSIFIEDSKKNAQDISSHGIPVILLDCPWNQGELPNNVTRVFSWQEAIEKVRIIDGQQ